MAGYREAAIAVLRDAGGPLKVKEITRRAIDRGILKPGGATPEASMGSNLYTDVKKNGEASAFRRVSRNAFELRPGPTGLPPDSQRIVTAGELRAMSELLFRGYGADKCSIDDGIDIKASNGYDNFDIRVSAATRNEDGGYVTSISKRQFGKNDAPHMRYVFVLRDPGNDLDFVIMPSGEMKKMIDDGDISSDQSGYKTSFKRDGGRIFLGTRDVESYRNDWDL